MNTLAFCIGAIIGIGLGVVFTAAILMPKLNDAENRIDSLLDWDDEQDVRLAELELYERNHN